MNGRSNQDDPKNNLPKDLQRLPKFGGSKKIKQILHNFSNPCEPIDYPSLKNLNQKLALSALKYSGKASLEPKIEETAKDLLEIGEENNLGNQKIQSDYLNQNDDIPPAPPAPFI